MKKAKDKKEETEKTVRMETEPEANEPAGSDIEPAGEESAESEEAGTETAVPKDETEGKEIHSVENESEEKTDLDEAGPDAVDSEKTDASEADTDSDETGSDAADSEKTDASEADTDSDETGSDAADSEKTDASETDSDSDETDSDEMDSDETGSGKKKKHSGKRKKEKKKEKKERAVFVHKKIKPALVIVGILVFAAVFLECFLMSREGVTGLLRQLLIPIALGAFVYTVVFLFLNLLAGHMKRGHRVFYILSEIFSYVVIIFIGYSVLNPVKDLMFGPKKLEVNILSEDWSTHDAGLRLTSNGKDWKDSKYHMTVTIYGKRGAEDEVYQFPVDMETYNYFRDNPSVLYLELEYYENTNTMKSCTDNTDNVLRDIFGDYLDDQDEEEE